MEGKAVYVITLTFCHLLIAAPVTRQKGQHGNSYSARPITTGKQKQSTSAKIWDFYPKYAKRNEIEMAYYNFVNIKRSNIFPTMSNIAKEKIGLFEKN